MILADTIQGLIDQRKQLEIKRNSATKPFIIHCYNLGIDKINTRITAIEKALNNTKLNG